MAEEVWGLFLKVFITGIAGFVGSSLASKLKCEGFEVDGIDNLYTGNVKNLSSGIKWRNIDLRDLEKIIEINESYDVIVHLGAQSSGEKSFEVPGYDIDTNIKGTYNMYEFAKKCGAKLFINMSSMSVYGDVEFNTKIDEQYVPFPKSVYGATKYATEQILSLLSERDGIPVVSLRLFNAYGPNQNLEEMKQGMISIYLSYLLYQDHIHVKGSLDRVRDILYIDDVVGAIQTIIESKEYKSGVFNLSSGQATSVREMLDMLLNASNIKKEIICEGSTAGDVMGFTGDNSKLLSSYNVEIKNTPRDGIEKMVNYYLKDKK